jgi:hypothetical protein
MYAVLLVMLCLVPSDKKTAPGPSPSQAQQESSQPVSNAQSKITTQSQSSLGIGAHESKDASDDEKKQRDAAYDKWLYHLYEWATVAGVVGGWVVLWIIWRQSNSVVNAERAWLTVELRSPEPSDPQIKLLQLVSEKTYSDSLTVTFVRPIVIAKNQGKTPAWIFECKIWSDFIDFRNFPGKPSFAQKRDSLDNGIMPVAAGSEVSLPVILPITSKREAGHIIRLYGFVRYTDIFGRRRKTEFGWGVWADTVLAPIDSPDFHKIA